MPYFYAEVTDTFGGEANYTWVRRYKVKANTFTGAIRKVPEASWHLVSEYGDHRRYDSSTGLTCCFVWHWDDHMHSSYTTQEI